MKKKFRIVAGKKFYCDNSGLLTKDAENNFEEVPETDTTAEEFDGEDSDLEEVQKMLSTARRQVELNAERSMGDAQVRAIEAVEKMFASIAEKATGNTEIIDSVGKASFDYEDLKKDMQDFYEGKSKAFVLNIKSKRDLDYLMKVTSEGGSLEGDVILPQRDATIEREPVRQVFIESISNVTQMTTDSLSYVEVVSESGAPLVTAELGLIPEKDFEFGEFRAPLKKVAVINKHSVELLQDAPQLVNAIKGWLEEDVNLVVDSQLLLGNGQGDNLTGVLTVAAVLDEAEVGDKRVQDANLYDVIRVAITKVTVAGKGKFSATHVILNPEDADVLDLTKDANGQYVLPPFRSADGTLIKGARVIENIGQPVGTFLVGDFRKLHVGTRGGVEIEFTNSDGTDFKHDILSVKLRRRIAAYVRQNDNGAFWTGEIDEVIEALTQS